MQFSLFFHSRDCDSRRHCRMAIPASICPRSANVYGKQERKMGSSESAREMPTFVEFFRGEVDWDGSKCSDDHIKTFNEFPVHEWPLGTH
ncbi:Phosphatidylserine decarboxylase proenzyme 3 [Nymphaea thermarum]|nr:Phosphatidylserine decarboxylase proenzyme 3 [Nymphaea thermarum]